MKSIIDNYDSIYQYCNELIHSIDYGFLALDHDIALDKLKKEFPNEKSNRLLEILLFVESDIK